MATRRTGSKQVKKKSAPRKAATPAARVGVSKLSQIASDVWLEIGPIWLEKLPTMDEMIIRESPKRLIKQLGKRSRVIKAKATERNG